VQAASSWQFCGVTWFVAAKQWFQSAFT